MNNSDAEKKALAANIPGIDPLKGISNSGGASFYLELLGDVYGKIDEKCTNIEDFLKQGNIKEYTTLVHALKTTCRMMGAIELSESFYTLEKLGTALDQPKITELTPGILEQFKALKPFLKPYVPQKSIADKDYNKKEIADSLNILNECIKDFDLSNAETELEKIITYKYPDDLPQKINTLKTLVENLDYDEAGELIQEILEILGNAD